MTSLKFHCKPFAYGGSLLLFVSSWIAPRYAQAQAPSPVQGQPGGAAVDSQTPGTVPIANPSDNLGTPMGGVDATQQAAIDKIFVKKAIQDGMTEVQLGELTLKKSNNDQVKQFAQKMIDDHTKENERLTTVAQELRADIPTGVTKKDKSAIGKMDGLSGAAYDQAYIRDMVKDHKQALSEFRLESSNGHDLGARDVATQGGTAISEHLQMAEKLAKDQNVDLAKK